MKRPAFSIMLFMADTLRTDRIIAEHLPENPVPEPGHWSGRAFSLPMLNDYIRDQFDLSQRP